MAIAALALLASDRSIRAASPAFDQNPVPAAAQGPIPLVSFSAGSLIIPMDGCYQRPSFMSDGDIESITGADTGAARCNDNSEKDDGLVTVYSLVARLVAADIPVHWVIRHGKSGWHDVDLSISKAGGAPVSHANVGDGSFESRYGSLTQIDYRGAPFVIDAANADAARALMTQVAATCAQGTCYSEIDVHRAETDFDAPVFRSIARLPKLAVLDLAGAGVHQDQTNKLAGSIEEALMKPLENALWSWVSVTEVLAGGLDSGGYQLVWVPPFDLTAAPTPTQQQLFDALATFADNGGSVLFQDGAIAAMEGVDGTAPVIDFQIDGQLQANGASASWDNCNASESTRSEDYSDPSSQFGGICWTGIGGSKYNWKSVAPRTFLAGARRQVITESTDAGDDDWTLASWRHKDNDSSKGRVYYLGGFHWRKTTASGFRLLLNTLLSEASSSDDEDAGLVEVTRSAPIVAEIDSVETHVQGSFLTSFPAEPAASFSGNPNDDTWEFPHVRGHLRAIATSETPDQQTAIDDVTALFDGADGLPPAIAAGCPAWFTTACRTVFTHTDGGRNPDRVFVTTDAWQGLQPLLGDYNQPTTQTLIGRILAGKKIGDAFSPALGGVDRSTPAVIEPSARLGVARPTMIYVGALDGMLHAFCADDVAPCSAGKELWAFVPRQQLGLLASNAARVDGSPTVSDVFGDFDGDGSRELRTVLTFQTGSGRAGSATTRPAVYALDVTDPGDPKILWERVAPDQRGDFELGVGLNTAMAPVDNLAGGPAGARPVTFAQTNNGGTAGAGVYLEAIDTATGSAVWSRGFAYPAPRTRGNAAVPASAIPGGATVFSSKGRPIADTLLAPSPYGDLWVLDPATGTSVYGSTPLFRFSGDYRPIGAPASVYRDPATGAWRAVIVSGGYADPNPTIWSPADVEQFAVGVDVAVAREHAPLSEVSVVERDAGWVVSLGVGRRAFAQAVIAGGELFVVTDNEDVNLDSFGSLSSSGALSRFSLADRSLLGQISLGGGGASVDISTGTQTGFAAGGATVQKMSLVGFQPSGESAELPFEERGMQLLWLRSQ